MFVKKINNHLVFNFLGVKLKIRYDNDSIFPYKRKEKRIKKYKYVHLMNNGIHSINILNFINKYFDNNEHCFVFPCVMFEKTKQILDGVENVFYCPINNIDLKVTDKIIIHGLFDYNLIKQLYKHKKYLPKTYWFIWGGDLYNEPIDNKEIYVKSHVSGILTSFDKDVYEEKYGKPKSYFDVTYPHGIDISMIKSNKSKDYIHIQINNSADETTLEMLDILSKFKDEKIKISTILSYKTVGHQNIQMQIMKKGYEIFKEKFNPLIEFLPEEEYAEHLASVDIYISNQNRQQGNGNATLIHSLGGKVFLKHDTSVYKKYNSIGMKIFDTYEIPNLNFEEFCAFDEDEKQKSISILKERMKDETKVNQWKNFFESDIRTKCTTNSDIHALNGEWGG